MNDQPCQSHQTPRRRERNGLLTALLILFMLFGAACASSSDLTTTASDAVAEAPRAAFDNGEAMFEIDADGAEDAVEIAEAEEVSAEPRSSGLTTTGAASAEPTAQLPDLGRDIIFTASLEIASSDVSEATRQAIRSIEGRGGFLFSQETRGGPGGTSVLTFKVLPEHFQAALNDLGAVGEVRSQSISADDVSAVVVDLESRINTAEASVARLRNLLDEASELETIATLENQLLQRETSLEQLRGQLRTVRNQVDLATITVFVSELQNRPGLALEAMSYQGHDAGFSCFDTGTIRSFTAGDPVTVCYRLTNTGDTPLVDLTFDDPALGASIGNMVVVDGSVSQIEPGTSTLVALETELSESVRVRTAVSATGLDIEGNEIDAPVQATAATMRFDIIETNDGVPSFGEVLGNSWNALVTAAIVIALIAVAIAPFALVLLALGTPLWLLIKRQRRARAGDPSATTPPPPAPAEPVAPRSGSNATDDLADANESAPTAITS